MYEECLESSSSSDQHALYRVCGTCACDGDDIAIDGFIDDFGGKGTFDPTGCASTIDYSPGAPLFPESNPWDGTVGIPDFVEGCVWSFNANTPRYIKNTSGPDTYNRIEDVTLQYNEVSDRWEFTIDISPGVLLWEGHLAGKDPIGTYNRVSGCSAGPTSLDIGCV